MRHAGLSPVVISGGPTEDHGIRAAKVILDGHPTATAVTVFNDRSAAGLLDAFRQSCRRIPEELSVVGYDNGTVAALSPLTTIAQNTAALAQLAITRVTTRLTDPTAPTTEEVILPSLIPRTTTDPPGRPTPPRGRAGAGRGARAGRSTDGGLSLPLPPGDAAPERTAGQGRAGRAAARRDHDGDAAAGR